MVGLAFNTDVIGPAIVLGTVAAGLYGLLAVSMVLTYRVSRTIGFVHGGLALLGTFLYWALTAPGPDGSRPVMGQLPGLIVVFGVGAAVGVVYGSTVTGRLACWPRVRLTTYSLGWLLALFTAINTLFGDRFKRGRHNPLPSLFGDRTYKLFGAVITTHQVTNLAVLVVVVVVLGQLLARTRTGVFIRAIADDPEAGRLVGIPLKWIGTGVYGLAGAISALAGALLATGVGINFDLVLIVFVRALTVSVLGGFMSLSLALAGCFVLAIGEAALTAGVFGSISGGSREILLTGVLFGLVLLINRFRPIRMIEVTGI